jgi:hypothetical protein
VTTPQPDPPLAPDEMVAAGSERDVLEAFLDFHREVLSARYPASLSRKPGTAARHVGHADILREQTDGAAGVDG